MSEIDEVKKAIKTRNSLSIARLPKKTLVAFKELADEEFCGDFGMTLKWLMDQVTQLTNYLTKLVNLETRITMIENNLNQPKEEVITTISGRVLRKTNPFIDEDIKGKI